MAALNAAGTRMTGQIRLWRVQRIYKTPIELGSYHFGLNNNKKGSYNQAVGSLV